MISLKFWVGNILGPSNEIPSYNNLVCEEWEDCIRKKEKKKLGSFGQLFTRKKFRTTKSITTMTCQSMIGEKNDNFMCKWWLTTLNLPRQSCDKKKKVVK